MENTTEEGKKEEGSALRAGASRVTAQEQVGPECKRCGDTGSIGHSRGMDGEAYEIDCPDCRPDAPALVEMVKPTISVDVDWIIVQALELAHRCMEGAGMYAHGGDDRAALALVGRELKTARIRESHAQRTYAYRHRAVKHHDDLIRALRMVVESGPLNNGMRDENTMAIASEALDKAEGR